MGEPVYNNPNIKKPVLDLSNIENLLTPEQLLSKEKIKARELQSDVASKQSKLKSYNYPTYVVDKLGKDFKPNFDNIYAKYEQALKDENDAKAEQQSWYGNIFRAVGTASSTLVREIGKLPGYLYGLGEGAFTDKTIGEAIDNSWTQFFDSMDENIKNSDTFKTYIPSDVQQGGLWDKMTSGSWWATTGAEGVGSLLSFLVPGQILKAAKLGTTFTKGARVLNPKLGTKFATNADDVTAALFNTTIEASAEAHESFKNIYSQLQTKIDSGELTDEEARQLAGEQASKVFAMNALILLPSNMLDQKWLFGAFEKSIGKKAVEGIGKETKWYKGIPSFTGTVAKGFLKEGAYEEGTQFATGKYFEQQALRPKEDEASNWIYGILDTYYNSLSDPQLHESVFLGGFLGGGMSLVGSVKQNKREREILY